MAKRRKRGRDKGRSERGPFLGLPHDMIKSKEWAKLTPHEKSLFIDLGAQYNGHNNGDLCIAWSMMKARGWRSPGTLHKAKKGLLDAGFVELTKQGGRHAPSLFALTIWGIDDCNGKHYLSPNPVPSNRWRGSFPSRGTYQSSHEVKQSTPDGDRHEG